VCCEVIARERCAIALGWLDAAAKPSIRNAGYAS
jgi:hypothetical protein